MPRQPAEWQNVICQGTETGRCGIVSPYAARAWRSGGVRNAGMAGEHEEVLSSTRVHKGKPARRSGGGKCFVGKDVPSPKT